MSVILGFVGAVLMALTSTASSIVALAANTTALIMGGSGEPLDNREEWTSVHRELPELGGEQLYFPCVDGHPQLREFRRDRITRLV